MSNRRLLCATLRRSAIAAAVGMCLSTVALAQSAEGSLRGRAQAGASVTITNVETGSTRQIKAESDGTFSFAKLQPGTYRITSGGVTREVSVAIGSGSEVTLDASQRVEVTGSRIRTTIDMASVESNSVFTQDQIRALPVTRSVDAVALLAPGTVKGDDFADGLTLPSFGGASIAENGYYINGLDVTNIRNFLSYAELPFDAIAQQQVKTGGYGAEYGRSLGGVISLVTKRGTNEWKGGVSVFWEPRDLRDAAPDVADREPSRAGLPYVFNSADYTSSRSYVAYGGGPIIKDRLFIFGSIEAPDDSRHIFNQSASENRTNTKPNGMVKVDFSLTERHQLEFTAISNRKKYTYKDYTSATPYSPTHDGVAGVSTAVGGGDVYIAKYTGYLTDDLTVSALAGRVTDKRLKLSGARQLGKDCPVVLEVDLSDIGCWTGPFPGVGDKDPFAPDDQDTRKSFRLDAEYNLGKHQIRAGIDNQTFASSEAGGSSYTGGFYHRYFRVPAAGTINGVGGFTPGTEFVRTRVLQSTSGTYEVENTAYYIEDNWKASKNLLLYGGLRWESFNNKNGDGQSFVNKKNLLAPRAGFAWDLSGDASLKVYGNFGRYYIPVASNTNIRGTRAELFTQRFFVNSGRDARTQAPLGIDLSTNGIGNPQVVSDGKLPDPGTVADTQLRPMNQDELILGIQKAVRKDLVLGAKATYRKINAGMDDYCDHTRVAAWLKANVNPNYVDSLATCMLMNPGQDLNIKVDINNDGKLVDQRIPASALGLANYTRKYASVELSLERPFDGKWGLQGSYTYSKSKGTAEGYVQSNLNQDDAGVTQDFDFGSFSDGSSGYLPNDRRHVLKVFGNYQLTQELRVGMNATIASGRPLSCIGFVPSSVPDFAGASAYTSASAYYCIQDPTKVAVLVPRGSVGRTPWTQTLDLSFAYMPEFAKKKLTLQVDVFNVLGARKATELNETRDFDRGASNGAPPYRVSQNYLLPTSFQDPFRVRFTGRYEF
jgi:Carboxypeptidase regulatory-like domain/TonB-dependent Receptor Plug Domain/TonB dependent receptor